MIKMSHIQTYKHVTDGLRLICTSTHSLY